MFASYVCILRNLHTFASYCIQSVNCALRCILFTTNHSPFSIYYLLSLSYREQSEKKDLTDLFKIYDQSHDGTCAIILYIYS